MSNLSGIFGSLEGCQSVFAPLDRGELLQVVHSRDKGYMKLFIKFPEIVPQGSIQACADFLKDALSLHAFYLYPKYTPDLFTVCLLYTSRCV